MAPYPLACKVKSKPLVWSMDPTSSVPGPMPAVTLLHSTPASELPDVGSCVGALVTHAPSLLCFFCLITNSLPYPPGKFLTRLQVSVQDLPGRLYWLSHAGWNTLSNVPLHSLYNIHNSLWQVWAPACICLFAPLNWEFQLSALHMAAFNRNLLDWTVLLGTFEWVCHPEAKFRSWVLGRKNDSPSEHPSQGIICARPAFIWINEPILSGKALTWNE